MKLGCFYLLLVQVFLLLAVFSIADTDTKYPCSSDQVCFDELNGNYQYYCSVDSGTCIQLEETLPSTPNEGVDAAPSSEEASALEQKVAALEQTISSTENDLSSIKNQLAKIEMDINYLNSGLQQDISSVNSQTNTLATGLAGLQVDVDETQSELKEVQKELGKKRSFTWYITIALIVLLVAGVAGGIIYYLTRYKKTVSPEIVNYITGHIQQGRKYPEIKQNLLKAGWTSSEIDWAYQETVKKNYQQYKGISDGGATATRPGLSSDKTKVISIVIVSILLVAGVLLILSGTTGKAVYFSKLIGGETNGTSGKVTYSVDCTPPHILTPDGDACCLDANNDKVCDISEREVGEAQAGQCTDDLQCSQGEYCIDGQCGSLSSIYKLKLGSKLCEPFYSVHITAETITQSSYVSCAAIDYEENKAKAGVLCSGVDESRKKEVICQQAPKTYKEEYNVKPKHGSYTGAGAIEWKVLSTPSHYIEEDTVIPIKVIKKRPGEIIGEETTLVKKNSASREFTHPDLQCKSLSDNQFYPTLRLKLVINQVFENCFE